MRQRGAAPAHGCTVPRVLAPHPRETEILGEAKAGKTHSYAKGLYLGGDWQ